MTPWIHRCREERALINPAFCAMLIWSAARGYSEVRTEGLSYVEAYLILPLILPRSLREALPRTPRTSLAVWLTEVPLARERIAARARALVPFTQEALLFGGLHKLIGFDQGRLRAEPTFHLAVRRELARNTEEVRECAARSTFVGKWFAHSGSTATVLAVIGVRP